MSRPEIIGHIVPGIKDHYTWDQDYCLDFHWDRGTKHQDIASGARTFHRILEWDQEPNHKNGWDQGLSQRPIQSLIDGKGEENNKGK